MRNLTITKWFISFALVLSLSVSSFAMGAGNKQAKPNMHNDKVKIEQKHNKKDIKIVNEKPHHKKDVAKHHDKKSVTVVKVYNEPHKKPHHHHHKHHNKVYYSSNDDFAAKCLGTGLCLIMLSAIAG